MIYKLNVSRLAGLLSLFTSILAATNSSTSHQTQSPTVTSTSLASSPLTSAEVSVTTTSKEPEDPAETCSRPSPSPKYWFADHVFHHAYHSNICHYDYCREQFNSAYPDKDALDKITKVVWGNYRTSVKRTITVDGTPTKTTSYFKTFSATTLHGTRAWWGGAGKELGGGRCCQKCQISAGTIDLRFWPTPAPVPAVSTIVEGEYTFISPSIYMAFDTMFAQDGCSTIGSGDHSNQTFAFDPSEISSISPVTVGGTTSLATYAIDWEKFTNQDCSSILGPDYNPEDPENLDPENYNPCMPRIAMPEGIYTKIDPAWSICGTARPYFGWFDPPVVLSSQAPLQPPETTTTPVNDGPGPTTPAVIPDSPAPPTSTPTPKVDPKPSTKKPGQSSKPKDPTHEENPAPNNGQHGVSHDSRPTAKLKPPIDIPFSNLRTKKAGAIITHSNHVFSKNKNGIVVDGSITVPAAAAIAGTLTLADGIKIHTMDNGATIIGSKILEHGQSVATVSGHTISIGADGIVADGVTVTLSGSTQPRVGEYIWDIFMSGFPQGHDQSSPAVTSNLRDLTNSSAPSIEWPAQTATSIDPSLGTGLAAGPLNTSPLIQPSEAFRLKAINCAGVVLAILLHIL